MDLAPHGLDLVDFFLGEPVLELHALLQRRVQSYEVDDGGMLVGQTGGGVLVTLHVAYNCPEGLPRRRLEVVGSRGQFTASDTMGQDPGGTLVFADGGTGIATSVEVADRDGSPFTAQIAAFSDVLRGGPDDGFSAARDLHTMRLLDRAYRADAARRAREPAPVRTRGRAAAPRPLF